MTRVCFCWLCCVFLFGIACSPATFAQSSEQGETTVESTPTTPVTKPDGSRWRIAFYQGGDYSNYILYLEAIVTELKKYGWLDNIPDSCFLNETKSENAWQCLSKSTSSRYIEFVSDAFWDAQWNTNLRKQTKQDAINRLSTTNDIDLVLAMGTWAGLDLANNDHHTPVVVISTSNALSSGIIKSVQDSGYDHVHARVDPNRYARQIQLFHSIFPFKKLGIVYTDTQEGRVYAGIDQIEPLTKRLDFSLVPCIAASSDVDFEEAEKEVLDCHKKLAPQVDAFYLTTHLGVSKKSIQALLAPFFQYKVPVFSMDTSFEVEHGALLSMAAPNFSFAGNFYARTITQIFHGIKPRDIPQLLIDPYKINVNIETAKRIGFHIPLDVLSESDAIYETIKNN